MLNNKVHRYLPSSYYVKVIRDTVMSKAYLLSLYPFIWRIAKQLFVLLLTFRTENPNIFKMETGEFEWD